MGNSNQPHKKYEAKTPAQVRDKLNKYGLCYVPNILTEEERMSMISGTWDYFEHLTHKSDIQIKRSVPESWSVFKLLYPIGGMIYRYWGAPHSQHMWDLRQNEKIVDVFAQFYNRSPSDLIVSLDGFAFLVPPEHTNYGWYKDGDEYFHIDQKYTETEFTSLQSFVTANEFRHGDATLKFYESSHKLLPNINKLFNVDTDSGYNIIPDDVLQYIDSMCNVVELQCPAKSLVIWDSRIIHSPIKARKWRKENNFRCIGYVNYRPRDLNFPLNLRTYEFENRLPITGHNPYKIYSNGKYPPNFSPDYMNLSLPSTSPNLTQLGRRLLGYD
jgi:hypothetical protein